MSRQLAQCTGDNSARTAHQSLRKGRCTGMIGVRPTTLQTQARVNPAALALETSKRPGRIPGSEPTVQRKVTQGL